jgi:hypothetical protein
MRAGFTSRNSGPRTSTKCGLSESHRAIKFSTSITAASRRSGKTARKWNATDHVLRSTTASRCREASERKSWVRSSTSFFEASTAGCQAPVSRRQPPCSATSSKPSQAAKKASTCSRSRPLTTATVTPGEVARSLRSASNSALGRTPSGVSANGMSVPSRSARMARGVQRARATQ